jgi:hypothetical protein
MRSNIVNFYMGTYRPPSVNKTLDEMWEWDNNHLEGIHGYLTWWFPTRKQSLSTEWDPITDEEIQRFKEDPELRKRFLKSFYRILRFYGMEMDASATPIRIKRSEDYEQRRAGWVTLENHNYRRITRILQSLMLLGFKDLANMFLEALMGVYYENQKIIGAKTYDYWTLSVSDPQYWNGTK